ncbi:MAG TPA: hypothetical protein VFZ09_41825 [Archangium sp.]|uniref:hypothetical protein n=1 Tax=Archangium sp. TaxID=1872627 RepID=UPI002E35B832|nr:hypothetical protein [Archangium sp.]HEX5752818.1 hypothetical protein [Archangium sp.]
MRFKGCRTGATVLAPPPRLGALWGSEVPLLGNAVGFIIGLGGYYLVDALTGEQVEQGVRRGLDGPTPRGR